MSEWRPLDNRQIDRPVGVLRRGSDYPKRQDGPGTALAGDIGILLESIGLNRSNPFAEMVSRGSTVLIKPNWVRDFNHSGQGIDCLITHPSVLEAVVHFCALAMDGEGTVAIGDCPVQNCDFDNLTRLLGIPQILSTFQETYPNLHIVLENWQLTVWDDACRGAKRNAQGQHTIENYEEAVKRFQVVDLGTNSFLDDVADASRLFRVSQYDSSKMAEHHRPGKHEYLITKRVFEADLMINLPKLKTHRLAAMTGAIRNLVGVNGHKEYLPHHTRGFYAEGGDWSYTPDRFMRRYLDLYDEYYIGYADMSPSQRKRKNRMLTFLAKMSKLVGGDGAKSGAWAGNDTLWRTMLDLNHVVYFDERSPKNIITIADGIVAGQGEGPLSPVPLGLGVLVAGVNPAYVDAVMAKMIGYNPARIPSICNAVYDRRSRFGGKSLNEIPVTYTEGEGCRDTVLSDLPVTCAAKPSGWKRAEDPHLSLERPPIN